MRAAQQPVARQLQRRIHRASRRSRPSHRRWWAGRHCRRRSGRGDSCLHYRRQSVRGRSDLLDSSLDLGFLGFFLDPDVVGQRQGGEHTDDDDHDEEFDQGEAGDAAKRPGPGPVPRLPNSEHSYSFSLTPSLLAPCPQCQQYQKYPAFQRNVQVWRWLQLPTPQRRGHARHGVAAQHRCSSPVWGPLAAPAKSPPCEMRRSGRQGLAPWCIAGHCDAASSRRPAHPANPATWRSPPLGIGTAAISSATWPSPLPPLLL